MKITSVRPWLIKSSASYWGEFLFVEVNTDEGITGWGEITTTTKIANRALTTMLRQIGSMLVGEDPARIEQLWHKLFRSFTYMGSRGAAVECVSAIDIALWDIRGKALDKPIYELLGGPVRDEIALYTHPDQRKFTSKEGVIAEIKDIVKSGHTALKFDPFPQQGPHVDGQAREQRDGYLDGSMTRKDEREAAELTALIRETAGPEIEILIDAHGRFDVPTAIRLCRTLEDAGQIDWFEEPVPPESFNALKQVREKVNAPISWGERGHTKWDFVPILENKLADYIMPDVTWTGGITELKKISALCEAYYIPVSPHDAAGPINVVAGAQVMMTVPNFYKLETSEWNLHKYDVLIDKPLDNSNGSLKLTTQPGPRHRDEPGLPGGKPGRVIPLAHNAPPMPRVNSPGTGFLNGRKSRTMKIVDLRCAVIGRHPIVRIVTDENIHGLGEVEYTKPYLKPFVLHFREALIGEDPTDVERVMLKIRQRGSFKPYGAAVSAIEHALWDIAGKAAGVPVYKLLGGKVRDQVRCYNGNKRRKRTGDRPEDYAADVKWMMEQPEGFFMVKQGITFHSNMKDYGSRLPLRHRAEEGRLSRRHGSGPDQRTRHGPCDRMRRGHEGGARRQGQPCARLRAGLVPARCYPLRQCGREVQSHVARGHAHRRLRAVGQPAGLSRVDAVNDGADPHRRADLPAP